jgi:hypothetical protein
MRRDEQLIDLFLGAYKDRDGHSYRLESRPDQTERAKPAVDCIAVNERGKRIALEHTLVEPFEGQIADNQPFLAVFERLHHSTELTLPNLLISILVPVGSIPTGEDWNQVGRRVVEWFRNTRLEVRPGDSDHKIPGLGFDLTVRIEAMDLPDSPGVLVVGRLRPADKPFSDMVRKALAAKLPKLVRTPADSRILLMEDASMILGMTPFSHEIDVAREAFPDLAHVDSVWLAKTSVWESERVVWFFHVWPGGVRERFTINL